MDLSSTDQETAAENPVESGWREVIGAVLPSVHLRVGALIALEIAAVAVVFAFVPGDGALVAAIAVFLVGGVAIGMLYQMEDRHAAAASEIGRLSGELARLREARDRLADLLDELPVGCYSSTGNGRLTYVNEALASWLGRSAEDLIRGASSVETVIERDSGASCRSQSPDDLMHEERDLGVSLRSSDGERLRASLTQNVGRGPDGEPYTRSVLTNAVATLESEEALYHLEQRFARLFEAAPIGIALVGLDGQVVECNPMFRSMTGDSSVEPEGKRFVDLLDERDRAEVEARLGLTTGHGRSQPLDVRLGQGDSAITATLFASPLEAADGEANGVILHVIDTSEQKSLEQQFFQSQKMQAVGQLAGGIAHDFNNLLTAMMGFCDLLLLRHQAGDQSFADIMQIKQNVNRAAGLVRQLLAFSRRQTLQPKVLVLTDVLAELSNLLRRLIGENIELEIVHSRNLGLIKVDQGQLEQVIINLAVNARDAMPEGGALTIRTRTINAQESVRLGHELLEPGDYVAIAIQDTGVGIPKAQQGQIFEPFFSTKEVGAGTGLGLSTVYGIVKQTGGYIFVESEPGAGATFNIFLPQYFPPAEELAEGAGEERIEVVRDLTGKGTILLVEDEDSVRTFGARALRGKGYTVLEADSGESALETLDAHEGEIDLLITDVVMPQMDGATLVDKVKKGRPDLKVIFISGYAEESFRKKFDTTQDIDFLPKPFSLAQLAGRVKEVLDAPPR